MNELVEAVQKTVRHEVAQVLRQAADVIDGDGQLVAGLSVGTWRQAIPPDPERWPRKLPERKQGKRGRPQGVGFRHQQVFDLLKRHPEGLAGSDIGKRCGMKGTQVYGVLKRLQRDGKVEKRGNKYMV